VALGRHSFRDEAVMTINVNEVQGWGDSSGTYALNQGAIIGLAHENTPDRFVVYKAFIDSFDYDREIDVEFNSNDADPLSVNPHIGGGVKSDKIKLTLKIASSNLSEALANHYKFQVLLRFIHVVDPDEPPHVHIYLKNLIQNSDSTGQIKGNLTHADIKNHGLKVAVNSLDYAPEMDLGFYEYKNRFFAKVFTLSFEMDAASANKVDNPYDSSRRKNVFSGKRPAKWKTTTAGHEPVPSGGSPAPVKASTPKTKPAGWK
jgi:hypothetical protein